jgi:hypothetical protein
MGNLNPSSTTRDLTSRLSPKRTRLCSTRWTSTNSSKLGSMRASQVCAAERDALCRRVDEAPSRFRPASLMRSTNSIETGAASSLRPFGRRSGDGAGPISCFRFRSPHFETMGMTAEGFTGWSPRLADEDLVDRKSGTPVRWVEGQGSIEEIVKK